jgi:CBS domain-containing protein
MLIRDVMTRGAECVGPDATLQEAARKMKGLDVGPLPVCDNDRIAGMVTDRDIVVRGIAEGKDPKRAHVRDIMTQGIQWCFEDDDVEKAAHLMQEKQIRRLIVLNRDKRMVGIVSLGDLASQTHDQQTSGKTLEKISEPTGPK